MKHTVLFVIVGLFVLYSFDASCQQYASTRVKDKYQTYTDSLKQVEYNYVFPIWGQQAYSKGFDIPYPAGIMGNYVFMS